MKRYDWLGQDLAVEADTNWNVLASYFYQPGVDAPISRTDSTQTVYYLADNAGSVTALANSSGAILGRYYYSPWGEVVSQDAGLPTQPLKWTGRELDETGLYYLRGRYYSPTLGRFLSEDPAGLSANLNLYLFGLNNPMGCRDPFGRCGNHGSSDYDPTAGGFSIGPPDCPWFSFDGESANTAGKQLCSVGDGMLDTIFSGPFFKLLGIHVTPSANAGVYDANDPTARFANFAGGLGIGALAGAAEGGGGGGGSPTGDLTPEELAQIQQLANEAGRPIYVAGSAARGARRGVGSDLPIGKGPVTRSDIDHIISPSSWDHWKGIDDRLPSIDPSHGPIKGLPNPHIGPSFPIDPEF